MTLTFQVEAWSDCLPELRPKFTDLWSDVAVDKDRFKAKCEEAKYKALEDAGAICLTTVRAHGTLVGYYCALIISNPHYEGQGLMAYTDMYYLDPEFRRGNTGLKLFTFSEQVWRERGAVKAYSSHKLHKSRGTMFAILGWKPTDLIYSKLL